MRLLYGISPGYGRDTRGITTHPIRSSTLNRHSERRGHVTLGTLRSERQTGAELSALLRQRTSARVPLAFSLVLARLLQTPPGACQCLLRYAARRWSTVHPTSTASPAHRDSP